MPQFLHAKDLFCRFPKRVGTKKPLQKINCVSLPNSPYLFSRSQNTLTHLFPHFYIALVLNIAEILLVWHLSNNHSINENQENILLSQILSWCKQTRWMIHTQVSLLFIYWQDINFNHKQASCLFIDRI
jgi:hypothetical protein